MADNPQLDDDLEEAGPKPEAGGKNVRATKDALPLSAEDRAFLSPARSLIETPVSPVRLTLAGLISALFLLGILIAAFGKVDIYAEAPGRIQPIGRSKVIQPLDPGRVLAISIRDGSHVRAGQLLLELDPTEAAATEQASIQKKTALSAEIARRAAAIAGARSGRVKAAIAFDKDVPTETRVRETQVFDADLAALTASVAELRSKLAETIAQANAARSTIAAHRAVVGTLSERVHIRSDLQRQGWESRVNVIDAQEDLGKEQASLVGAEGQLAQLLETATTARRQIDETISKFIDDNAQSLRDAQNKLDQADQDLVKARSSLRHTRLIAPIDGVVQQLAVTTVGQVVTSGEQLMTIVPLGAPLQIEAEMQNRDVGFVRPGQDAVIKIDAFPFTRYGTIAGRVIRVSRDAVDSQEASTEADSKLTSLPAQASSASPTAKTQNLVYPVTVQIDATHIRADGRDVLLSPGMSVSVEVKTGQRSALSYLLSPVVEITSESGHER